jgi:hypothetical protein
VGSNRRQRREADVQLYLSFLQLPAPSQQVWESLDDEQRQDVIDRLFPLIARAALETEITEEEEDGD